MILPVGTYTFYNNLENCPFKAYNVYVAKTVPYVETPEMKWGNDVHKGMEDRISKHEPLPETMQVAEPLARIFDAMPVDNMVRVEYRLGMTAEGQGCDFFAANVWFRVKADTVVMPATRLSAWVVDWKTGNVREDPFELECASLMLRANHPELQHVVGEYFWMKEGKAGYRYTLNTPSATFGKLQALRTEAEGYFTSGHWPKRKNPLCGWCAVTSCENNTSHRRK